MHRAARGRGCGQRRLAAGLVGLRTGTSISAQPEFKGLPMPKIEAQLAAVARSLPDKAHLAPARHIFVQPQAQKVRHVRPQASRFSAVPICSSLEFGQCCCHHQPMVAPHVPCFLIHNKLQGTCAGIGFDRNDWTQEPNILLHKRQTHNDSDTLDLNW